MNLKVWNIYCLLLLSIGTASAANTKESQAFALVAVLAQKHTLPFYNFQMKLVLPRYEAPENILAFIEYDPKTGKFEQKRPVVPVQIMPKTFTTG